MLGDPYQTLGISPTATVQEARAAWLQRVRVLHPDRFDPATQKAEWDLSTQMLQDVNAAWETIRAGEKSFSTQEPTPPPPKQAASQPPPTQPPVSQRKADSDTFSTLAITSLALTLLGLFLLITGIGPLFWAVAIVLAHAAKSSIRKHGYRGRWMATFTMWVGYLGWIGIFALLAFVWGTNFHKRVLADYRSSHPSAPSSQDNPFDQFDRPVDAPAASTNTASIMAPQPMQVSAAMANSVPGDSPEAAAYRVKAAAGDVESARKLGLLYYHGQGVPQDYVEASKWIQVAAVQGGDSIAQRYLGEMYEIGRGVDQNFTLALGWYSKAAAQGDAEAAKDIGNMYFNGDEGKSDPVLAFSWYKKAAAQENADAQYHLGLLYQLGVIGTSDDGEALKWYQKAAAHGDADAEEAIGDMYQFGSLGSNIVAVDLNQALSWYQKAAAQGNARSQLKIAEMYENGLGVTKDISTAVAWYKKAAEDGDPVDQVDAQKSLRRLGY